MLVKFGQRVCTMFAIHQRIRRRICQAGFCLFCALPTTGLLAWTATLKTSGYASRCRQELTQCLGMECRFKRVSYPQPGETLYEDLQLVDPETGQWVLHCRVLSVTQTNRKLVLEPSELEVSAEQAQKLLRLVMRRLTHELPGQQAILLVPTSITVRTEAAEQTYDDVEGRIESEAGQSTATLRFHLPELQAGEPPMFSVARKASVDGLRTTVKLETLGAALPVAIFSPWLELRRLLGDDAAFQGSLIIEAAGDDWSGELSGVFTHVDFERLIAHRFPHHLAGRASIAIESSQIDNGRLAEASGQVLSESGTIGGSFLVAAVEQLACPPGPVPPVSDRNYRYRNLSVEFAIDERGLLLTASPEAPGGAIMLDQGNRTLLAAPTTGPLPLIQLVKALVPDNAVQVPATKETAALVPWLPLPPIVPPPDDAQSPRSLPLHVE
jgi:hypothetical protein